MDDLTPAAVGDPRDCRGTCPHWDETRGDCSLPENERRCGRRGSRLALPAGVTSFDLFTPPPLVPTPPMERLT